MEHPVLLVNPGELVVARVSAALENLSIPLVSREFGMEGIGQCEEMRPSVVVCPARFGDFDGTLFLTELAKVMPDVQRVLAISKEDEGIDVEEVINRGAAQYFFTETTYSSQIPLVIEGARRKYLQGLKQAEVSVLLQKKNVELETMTHHLETLVDHRTRQIEKAKQEWEKTFDAIIDPLTIIDDEFTINRGNLAAARAAFMDIRHMPGARCYKALFQRDEPCETCPLRSKGASTDSGGLEAEVTSQDGQKTFRLSVYGMESTPGDFKRICYYKDVTEEKKLLKQVTQAEKMAGIGQLAGGVAHELNNPIGVILSFTQLSRLPAQQSGDEELVDNLDEIGKAAERCKKIISNLLEFSRPSLDQGTHQVSLNETIESAHFLVSTQRAIKNLKVVKTLADESPQVRANSNELLQVFINLIHNASQAMDATGVLTLETGKAGPVMAFARVTDTGEGISRENLKRIFEPFFTTKAPGEGTGLGLSVTYGIIERHDGVIDVRSEVGKGTTFEVRIPLWTEPDLDDEDGDEDDPTEEINL